MMILSLPLWQKTLLCQSQPTNETAVMTLLILCLIAEPHAPQQ